MNFAHIHLFLNHVPIMGIGFGMLVLLYGLARKNCAVVRVSFGMFVLSALVCVPVYFTGEPAEHVVRGGVPDVANKIFSEPHEQAGLFALIFVSITGVSSLAALYVLMKKRECKAPLTLSVLVIALFSLVILLRTAQLGGKINHPELRPGYVMPPHAEDEDED